jgi:hypothetical protein
MTEPLPATAEVQTPTGRRGVIVEVLADSDAQQQTTWFVVQFEGGERAAYPETDLTLIRQTFRAGPLFLTRAQFAARLKELQEWARL